MTIPSYIEQSGLSISAWIPDIDVSTPLYVPRRTLVTDALAATLVSYHHDILADGGWWSADITFSAALEDAAVWFENGLNRHIEVYNASLENIWAGFVNQVTLSAGTLSAVRGPLMDVTNRVSVTYTPILDATTVPPIEGSETTTTIEDNDDSQALYGILEEVVSGGKLLDDGTTDDAVQLRDTYLAENALPQASEEIDISRSGAVTVQLDCLGYVHRFQKYIYQDTTAATVQVDAKIPLVIAADPNGLFSTDYSQIATNAVLTSRYEDDNRMAWDVLMQEVALGDAAYTRYTLGVYQDQQIVYAAVPTTATYQHSILSQEMQVEQYGSGTPVAPWDVLPARWLFLYDFLPGRGQPAALRDDPRFVFIESVRFTAPNTVQLAGQKFSRIPQMIAQLSG